MCQSPFILKCAWNVAICIPPFFVLFSRYLQEDGQKDSNYIHKRYTQTYLPVAPNDTYVYRSGREMDNSCCQEIQAPETTLIFFLIFFFGNIFQASFQATVVPHF